MLLALVSCGSQHLYARKKPTAQPQKLPAAEKIVEGHLQALGGKKRVALIRDATYEWTIQLNDQILGKARLETKAPGSLRSVMTFGNGQIIHGANANSAWVQGLDGQSRRLTGAEESVAKLQALLEASHLVDYRKLNVMARVIALGDLASKPAFVVEFSMTGGARLHYWFSLDSKLLVKIEDEARKTTTRFSDYRPVATPPGVLEPHRLTLSTGSGELTFLLQRSAYNSGIVDSSFDLPSVMEDLDLATLSREGRSRFGIENRLQEVSDLVCHRVDPTL